MFNSSDLSVLAYANNFTLWHYTTTDLESTLLEGNYFGPYDDTLHVNDLIIASCDTDGKPTTQFFIVDGNQDGQVSVKLY